MKRFYCTICQKIKHVRRVPKSVVNPHSKNPMERQGQCSWHVKDAYYTRNTLHTKVGA